MKTKHKLQSACQANAADRKLLRRYGKYLKYVSINSIREGLINNGTYSYRKIKQNYHE